MTLNNSKYILLGSLMLTLLAPTFAFADSIFYYQNNNLFLDDSLHVTSLDSSISTVNTVESRLDTGLTIASNGEIVIEGSQIFINDIFRLNSDGDLGIKKDADLNLDIEGVLSISDGMENLIFAHDGLNASISTSTGIDLIEFQNQGSPNMRVLSNGDVEIVNNSYTIFKDTNEKVASRMYVDDNYVKRSDYCVTWDGSSCSSSGATSVTMTGIPPYISDGDEDTDKWRKAPSTTATPSDLYFSNNLPADTTQALKPATGDAWLCGLSQVFFDQAELNDTGGCRISLNANSEWSLRSKDHDNQSCQAVCVRLYAGSGTQYITDDLLN